MENWKDIHKDFGGHYGKTYQQSWEEKGLTYQNAKQWILAGLKPSDYNLASYLKQNNITPEQYKNNSSQILLNYKYPNKSQVETINLKYLNFNQPSELIIDNYPNLKWIIKDLYKSIPNLTKLTITNCPQLERISINKSKNIQQLTLNNLPKLKELNCSNNNLATLDLSDCANLEIIECHDNQLTQIKLPKGGKLEGLSLRNNNLNQDLSFLSGLVGLKELDLRNNPLHGSLEYLKGMSKLETLYIKDTDLDSGLEYLPDSLQEFKCSVDYRKDAKVKAIYDLFANDQGRVKTEPLGNIENFLQKLKEYKKNNWKNLNFSEEEIKQWISAGLTFSDYNFAEYLKIKNYTPNQGLNLTELREEYQKELQNQKTIWEKLQGKETEETILHQRWKQDNLTKLDKAKLEDQLKLLQEQKQQLEELNQKLLERIPFLEKQIEEFTYLIKDQKDIINRAYLAFGEEEAEALQELIKAHKTYLKAKKHREPANELRKQYNSLCQQLETKLGKEFIESVEIILTNFEELYQYEWSLQKQSKEKEQNLDTISLIKKDLELVQKSIEEKSISQITYIIDNINVEQGHALIGNTFGDNTNLNQNKYATRIEEISEETEIFEAKIQQAETYGIPDSSKN